MTTLATRLPYSHPFAGGYPRLGGQALPTDPDAIDYLARVAAADGAAVEVGVAMAVDQFVKGCKADSAGYAGDPTRTVWDALQACCIMAGARTISGALVPLVGDAPTPYNFTASDYSRTTGIKGDGSTTYLDTNRSGDSDAKNDNHLSAYVTAVATANGAIAGNGNSIDGLTQIIDDTNNSFFFFRNNSASGASAFSLGTGLAGVSRSDASSISVAGNGSTSTLSLASVGDDSSNINIFARRSSNVAQLLWDGRAAFYSIGSALDLAALDARVTNLVKGIQFWHYTGLSPHAYDPDTISYVVAGYAAGGTL